LHVLWIWTLWLGRRLRLPLVGRRLWLPVVGRRLGLARRLLRRRALLVVI
jgi:hypothetical protein